MSAYVKCGSHRARNRLNRLCGEFAISRMVWMPKKGPVHGVEIPDEMLDEALTIPMVTRWRIPEGLTITNPWTGR